MESREMIVWPNYSQKVKIGNIINEFNKIYAVMLAEAKTKKTKKEIKEYCGSKKFLESISNKLSGLEYKNILFDEALFYFMKQANNYFMGRVNSLPLPEVFDFAYIVPNVRLDVGCIEIGGLGKLMMRSGIGEDIKNIKRVLVYRKLTDYKVKVIYDESENVVSEEPAE